MSDFTLFHLIDFDSALLVEYDTVVHKDDISLSDPIELSHCLIEQD